MNHVDLCSGIGGFALALKHLVGGFRTVCYVEIDNYCQRILKQRIADGILDDAPIWDDLRTFRGAEWRGCVDIVTAGFPCQPFSVAGKRKGDQDERNLWPDVARIIREIRPRYALLENVPGLLTAGGDDGYRYYGEILGSLAESGYDVRWDCIPASAVGANHRRDRLWILAHTISARTRYTPGQATARGQEREHTHPHEPADIRPGNRASDPEGTNAVCTDGADASSGRHQSSEGQVRTRGNGPQHNCWWDAEPNVGRVAHGVPSRVDRLRALGNAVVPAVVAKAWEVLK